MKSQWSFIKLNTFYTGLNSYNNTEKNNHIVTVVTGILQETYI